MRYLKTLSLVSLLSMQTSVFADVIEYYNSIKSSPLALYAFFKSMPKGGELHYHLDGGAYPEAMLNIAARNKYCLQPDTLVMMPYTEQCHGIPASELEKHPDLYDQVLKAWSMKDFIPTSKISGHDQFFSTFAKFMPLAHTQPALLLADVMQRAANQHEHYLEVMILPDQAKSTTFAPPEVTPDTFAATKNQLLANPAFQQNIDKTVTGADQLLHQTQSLLGCQQNHKIPACRLNVHFQYYILRNQPYNQFFAQALNGFAAAAKSKGLVGVNLVQAEDGIIALRDYRKQMQALAFFHQAFPSVHIALHAGELSPQSVAPEQLRFHIRDAIKTGAAERIGHGVDVAYEDDAETLLNLMNEKQIPVEINLISNKKILGIEGAHHPLRLYLEHDIPVVLSTDDEGVLRTDLTSQYVEAARQYGLDYPTLKQINRNALTYSFLPGKSLWADPVKGIRIANCQILSSKECDKFTHNNEKARIQRELELDLTAFEKQFDLPQPFPAVG